MPTTIQELFDTFNVKKINKVPWSSKIIDNYEGIYIVSLSPCYEENLPISFPSFDNAIIKMWIDNLSGFTIDNIKPTVHSLKKRLNEFWLEDESILYIGKASKRNVDDGVGNRVDEYYRTKIGSRSPHSGGQWLKTLTNIKSMTVFYGNVNDSASVEIEMFDYFISKVSETSLSKLRDKKYPLPFANLRYKTGVDKNSGLKNQRFPR